MVLVFWYSSQDWNNWVLAPLIYIKVEVEVQQNLMLNSVTKISRSQRDGSVGKHTCCVSLTIQACSLEPR